MSDSECHRKLHHLKALHEEVLARQHELLEADRNAERKGMEAEGDFSDSWKTLGDGGLGFGGSGNWKTCSAMAWWCLEGGLRRSINDGFNAIRVAVFGE